jgi:hypothetical protein
VSDALLTVSPTYAREICEDLAMACGMQRVLRARGVRCAAPSARPSPAQRRQQAAGRPPARHGSPTRALCACMYRYTIA